MEKLEPLSNVGVRIASSILFVASSSVTEVGGVEPQQSLLHAHHTEGSAPAPDRESDHVTTPACIKIPALSPSLSTPEVDGASIEKGLQTGDFDSPSSNRSSLVRKRSGHAVKPLHTRRQTSDLNPLSNVVTSPSVHAAYISNPTSSRSSSIPSTPTSDTVAKSAFSSLTTHLELAKLTDDVAPPRKKNTPPLTPRALSNDGSESNRPSHRTGDQSNGNGTLNGARATSSTPHSSPPVSSPKGKLSVVVCAARGLRPCYNPYAVIVFEWIESVARPSRPGQLDSDVEVRNGEYPSGGVPITKTGSDMGRSMAIPMKSRQSSNTSLKDQKDFKNGRQIADPQWDHVALL